MNIKEKILEFRKKQMQGVPSKAAYRVSKGDAIEFAEFCIECKKGLGVSLRDGIDAGYAIKFAKEEDFYGMLHDLIKGSRVFGVDLHPDWQEYASSPMYY